MPVYTVTTALPAVVYVNNSAFPTDKPWEGATVIYDGDPSKPLHISGPFDLPPYVQDSVRAYFEEVYARPPGEQRAYAAAKTPWTIEEPQPAPPTEEA